jgi:hypothetical protein
MDSSDNNRQGDLPDKFIRRLISRLPGGSGAEKILGKVEEVYIMELRQHIDCHTKDAKAQEQSGHEDDALVHSLLVELYLTLLEKALADRNHFHE